ncbi:hypothetical protein ACFWUZ_18225 [Streptomyces sp. NPDC058646]|uniref:hypothetical protein n=1 Tax=Streptomyces sp. NPDC058646 TaxID=3346574 RepID=UPI00366299E3
MRRTAAGPGLMTRGAYSLHGSALEFVAGPSPVLRLELGGGTPPTTAEDDISVRIADQEDTEAAWGQRGVPYPTAWLGVQELAAWW